MILATSWASDLTYLLKERLGIDLGADIYSEYIFGYIRDNEVISGVRL